MIMTQHESNEGSPIRPHESAMRRAMGAYREGDYGYALLSYHDAYDAARKEPKPTGHELVGQIRAARGVGVCLMRGAEFPSSYFETEEAELGTEPAEYPHNPHYWFAQADKIADDVYDASPDLHEAWREISVTQETRWRYNLRKLIAAELDNGEKSPIVDQGEEIVVGYDTAWMRFLEYEANILNKQPDQNRINMAGRYAVALGLYHSSRAGLRQSVVAAGLGMRSESPRLPTSLGNLTRRERMKTKAKDVVGAVGAAAVALLATSNPTRRRTAALKTAQRLV